MTNVVEIAPGVTIGAGDRFVLMGGPCVIESRGHLEDVGGAIKDVCARLGISFVLKSSFDKANRTSFGSERGPGLEAGLEVLASVKQTLSVPIVTDIHESWQARVVAEVADVLQIPAFLCRQTDLLLAAGATGRTVNVKKGQFLAPDDMKYAVKKLEAAGSTRIVLTERGTTFGYNALVVDFRSLPLMRGFGWPVVFDATHSVQLPGGGDRSSGRREFVPYLARAAAAVGVDGFFMEIHEDPDHAPSDGPNMVRLADLEPILADLLAVASSALRLPPLQ